MSARKICVVTGTRADYGLLYWPLKELQKVQDIELQLIVTGMHLANEFGWTCKTIEEDGFVVTEKLEMLLSSDTNVGVTKSLGMAIIGFADIFERLKPDVLLLLGDRFEILAAAQAALIANIPIAHIAGGDTTEGAFDEAIRHSISKMSHIHFATNELSVKRLVQLGENPQYIFNVGSPGIDQIKRLQLLNREELEKRLDFQLRPQNLLVTFHPVSLEKNSAQKQFQELLNALDELGNDVGIILTKPNADPEGRELIQMIDSYVSHKPNAKAFTSMGSLLYLSAMAQVDAVVGNSSSGLYEAPSFHKPTVNIGDRQKGRLQAASVLNCSPESTEIAATIRNALAMDVDYVENPYGDGNSSSRIVKVLQEIPDYKVLLKKRFFDVEGF